MRSFRKTMAYTIAIALAVMCLIVALYLSGAWLHVEYQYQACPATDATCEAPKLHNRLHTPVRCFCWSNAYAER
jgi:cytochrome c-type biogenesis protein CcmH/NrfG